MVSVQICALLVLVAVAAAHPKHRHVPDEFKKNVVDCAEEHDVNDIKDAMMNTSEEYGCFYKCLQDKMGNKMKDPESPMAQDLASCEESITKSGNECTDAYELKKCIKEKFMAKHPKKSNDNDE